MHRRLKTVAKCWEDENPSSMAMLVMERPGCRVSSSLALSILRCLT